MYLAIGVDPTKETALIPGWPRIASTAALSPCTTLNTPSGRPASLNSWAMRIEAEGTFSEGLRMNVLPQAIAIGNIQSGTIAGKLNGVMPAQTPTGWGSVGGATPVPTFSEDSPMRPGGTTGLPPIQTGTVESCVFVSNSAGLFMVVLRRQGSNSTRRIECSAATNHRKDPNMEDQIQALEQVRTAAIDLGMKFGPKLLVAILILLAGYAVGPLGGPP